MEDTITLDPSWYPHAPGTSDSAYMPRSRWSPCYACGHLIERRVHDEAQVSNYPAHVSNEGLRSEVLEHSQHIPTNNDISQRHAELMTYCTNGNKSPELSQAETRIDGSWIINVSDCVDWRVSATFFEKHLKTLTRSKAHPLQEM